MTARAAVAMREAFGQALVALAPQFPELVVLDADVATSTRTLLFAQAFPERFFNVGVAEANLVDIAGGMATCGLRPVVSTFAVFISLKAAEQVQTAMPNLAVVAPADGVELAQALEAALRRDGPTYLRICRNPTPVLFEGAPPFQFGKVRKLRDGGDVTIAVSGVPTFMALEAAERLAADGIAVDLLEVPTIKPLDVDALLASARKTGRVLTVEEHTIHGGLGSAVAEALGRHAPARLDMVGLEDCFAESGDYLKLLDKYGISAAHIARRARRLVGQASACRP